jgi:hypothetical protein
MEPVVLDAADDGEVAAHPQVEDLELLLEGEAGEEAVHHRPDPGAAHRRGGVGPELGVVGHHRLEGGDVLAQHRRAPRVEQRANRRPVVAAAGISRRLGIAHHTLRRCAADRLRAVGR